MRRSLLLLLPLALVACGSGQSTRPQPPQVDVHQYGRGATRVWVFAPAARPKLIVLFVHGLGNTRETTPTTTGPGSMHLAREGYEVVYPVLRDLSVPARRPQAPDPGCRGGAAARGEGRSRRRDRLLAGRPARDGLRQRLLDDRACAGRILSPSRRGSWIPLLNLQPLAGHAKVLILAGDRDTTVGTVGAGQLVTQLAASSSPYADVRFETVRSHGDVRRRPSVGARPTPRRRSRPSGRAPTASSRRSQKLR